jgi:hypothetical protein
MPRKRPRKSEGHRERPEDQASNWFLTMEIAEAHGDFQAAAEAQRQLTRLGWDVTRHRPRRDRGKGVKA